MYMSDMNRCINHHSMANCSSNFVKNCPCGYGALVKGEGPWRVEWTE